MTAVPGGELVTDLRFRLLGPMEIRVDGRALALPGTAERALLAQLLLSPGRTIPASMLIDRLWAESTLPVDPMNALQIRVSKLRRSLKASEAPDVVSREGVGYRANVDPEAVDAIDFGDRVRAARAAAADMSGREVSPEFLEAQLSAVRRRTGLVARRAPQRLHGRAVGLHRGCPTHRAAHHRADRTRPDGAGAGAT